MQSWSGSPLVAGNLEKAATHLAVLGSFIGGSTLGALLLRASPTRHQSLLVAAGLVGGAAVLWPDRSVLLVLSAAMGLQNAAEGTFGALRLSTVVLTGTFTRLGDLLVGSLWERRADLLGQAAVLALIATSYIAGAAAGAVAILLSPALLLVPAALLLLLGWRHKPDPA